MVYRKSVKQSLVYFWRVSNRPAPQETYHQPDSSCLWRGEKHLKDLDSMGSVVSTNVYGENGSI